MPHVHRKLLSIAFAGKRTHHHLDNIIGPMQELFQALAAEFPGTHLQLLSGLADGADQIVSDIFIKGEDTVAAGGDQATAQPYRTDRLLGAVLPFPLLEYIKTIQNKHLFQTLYDHASYRLHLDGRHDGGNAANQKDAYRQQARVLPRLCDIFLAAVEKEEEGQKGGTKEAIHAALLSGKPVILLNLKDLRFYFYRSTEEWFFQTAIPLTTVEIAHACARLYQKDIFLSNDAEPKDIIFFLRRAIWNRYDRFFHKNSAAGSTGEEAAIALNNPLFYQLEAERKKASESSKYFMFQYRGGYLLNYFLAITAIFIAVNTSTLHFFKLENHFPGAGFTEGLLLSLALIKVGIILLIIRNTQKINQHQYNSKAIKFRYAAERLRVISFFSLFGVLKIPRPFVGNHIDPHLKDYEGEALYRRIISDIMIQSRINIEIGKEYILETTRFIRDQWLAGQVTYYEKDRKKMKKMDRKLVSIPEWLGKLVLIIVIAEILEFLLPPSIRDKPFVKLCIDFIIPVLIALTILLPGIITTINSMHFQTEAKRLAFRNDIMFHQLSLISARLDKKLDEMTETDNGSELLDILLLLSEAASLTTDEVAEWTMIYEKPVFADG
jgi:hypothetical protein